MVKLRPKAISQVSMIINLFKYFSFSQEFISIEAVISFYTPRKQMKTRDFLMLSGCVEMNSGMKWIKKIQINS